MPRLLAGVVVVLLINCVSAGEVRTVNVAAEQGIYTLEFDAIIDANFSAVHQIVTDHDKLDRLSEVILESQILSINQDDTVRRRFLMETCVLFFCFKATLVEDAEEIGQRVITTTIVPALSDFKFGRTYWDLEPETISTSRLTYQCIVEPDFWIPPVIGPWLIKKKMQEEAHRMIMNIEELASNE